MNRTVLSVILLAAVAACTPSSSGTKTPTFSVELTESAVQEIADLGLEVPIVGRVYVILTSDGETEPRASFEYGRRKPHCWIGYSPWRSGEDLSETEFLRLLDEYWKGRGGRW